MWIEWWWSVEPPLIFTLRQATQRTSLSLAGEKIAIIFHNSSSWERGSLHWKKRSKPNQIKWTRLVLIVDHQLTLCVNNINGFLSRVEDGTSSPPPPPCLPGSSLLLLLLPILYLYLLLTFERKILRYDKSHVHNNKTESEWVYAHAKGWGSQKQSIFWLGRSNIS